MFSDNSDININKKVDIMPEYTMIWFLELYAKKTNDNLFISNIL